MVDGVHSKKNAKFWEKANSKKNIFFECSLSPRTNSILEFSIL